MKYAIQWLGLITLSILSGVVAAQDSGETSIDSSLRSAALEHRLELEFDGINFSGPAWDSLLQAASQAQFFIIGEEHGIAENPKLAAALFGELADMGYSKVAIEISPPMAEAIDATLRQHGMEGLMHLYAQPGAEPAFYGMREEAEFLASVVSERNGQPVLWGTDYEVGADRHLLRRLGEKEMPAAARDAFESLKAASQESWAQYGSTGNPQFIFSFAGDPALVHALSNAWPGRDDEAERILHTLGETLEINRLWTDGRGWQSNERRGALMRENFLRYWRQEKQAGRAPRALVKFGASHVVRGRNMTDTFDLGSLLPEIAALEGRPSFSLLVLPGNGSKVARFNPAAWSYQPAPFQAGYAEDLAPIISAAHDDMFTLIDLRPLRPIIGMRDVPKNLARIVHGFDAVLIMSGSTASGELEHPDPEVADAG